MPFKSEAQRRYFNANRSKLEKEGVDVDEWNAASKGTHPPERLGMPLGDAQVPKQVPMRGRRKASH